MNEICFIVFKTTRNTKGCLRLVQENRFLQLACFLYSEKKEAPTCVSASEAEAEGFEPPVPCGTPVFKTGAIDQLCQTSVRVQIYGIPLKMLRF